MGQWNRSIDPRDPVLSWLLLRRSKGVHSREPRFDMPDDQMKLTRDKPNDEKAVRLWARCPSEDAEM
jgi:hypothetical protein